MIHEYDITKSFYEYDSLEDKRSNQNQANVFDNLPTSVQLDVLRKQIDQLNKKNEKVSKALEITKETLRITQEELKVKLRNRVQ